MPSMKLEQKIQGKEYWRSLDQLADTPEFNEFLQREFPENASEMTNPVTRRKFLSLMGASIAFAGLAGCRRPVEKIVPYVTAPENVIPGKSLQYATAMPFGLSSYGLIVESHVGRPTKIEGNPRHPLTRGKSNRLIQAEILNLYDPDRSKKVLKNGSVSSWESFNAQMQTLMAGFKKTKGAGLAVVSGSFASPSLFRLYEQFKKNFPKADWVAYEAVSDENIYNGMELAFGKPVQPMYDFSRAKVVLALDSDFLLTETNDISATSGFAKGRNVDAAKEMNRLYVVENAFTSTGAMADHRLRLQTGLTPAFAIALLEELRGLGLSVKGEPYSVNGASFDRRWLKAVAKDLMKNGRNSLVIAGQRQPALVHAICAQINEALGSAGTTVTYVEQQDVLRPSTSALKKTVEKMKSGAVNTLVMLNVNPVYDGPADLDFKQVLGKLKHSISYASHVDETAALSEWHVPSAHFLESWSDVRSFDGTATVIQPLIEPLFKAIPLLQMARLLIDGSTKSDHELVQETWKDKLTAGSFDRMWRRVLNGGVYSSEPNIEIGARIREKRIAAELQRNPVVSAKAGQNNLEVVFAVSPSVFDGRYANNGWLQEMPHPVSKLAWDNPAFISIRTAQALGLKNEDMVVLNVNGKSLKIPVWILPGHADNSVTLTLGYGRKASGRVGNGTGFDMYPLRTSAALGFVAGGTIRSSGETYAMANTQDHGSMEGRPLVREATLSEFKEEPHFAEEMVESPALESLWEERPYDAGNQWGMTIDLNSCTGCNACMIACQSENNIPVVGKEQVRNGREMSWIRLDRYFSGDVENPYMVYQPVNCQQCENAPCEQVCPVAATSHDEEGLNVMTYNRCIGTRYCSNNCPYKVRRFNFFNYTKDLPEVMQMAQNPDVTVRFRGVMEKCTFCTQRITRGKIDAKNQGRALADGDVLTACQQTCPADAIVFGNLLDPKSKIAESKKSPRNYALLGEFNLKPRNTFLAKVRNPNPELADYQPQA